MAIIVRELLAKLGFQIDNRPLNQFNGSIESAKSKLVRLVSGSDRARDSLGRFVKQTSFAGIELKSFAKAFDGVLVSMAKYGALAGGGLVALTVHTAASFEKLGASLRTVTGSVEGAQSAMSSIKKFASETPFSVEEVANAFVKLKALGLDPSEEALRSYGNTASAMGKSLSDFIEAIADASTGEFERLKEFGIKAKSQGDQVSFTFQGVTKTVGKNAAEIEAYLRTIGDNQFAGAMAQQMETFGGIVSNLKDNFDALLLQAAEGGLLSVFKEIAAELRDMAAGGGDLAKQFGSSVANAVRAVWNAVKRLLPSLRSLADSFANDLIPLAVKLVEGIVAISETLGGLDNAIVVAVAGLGALRLATLSATSPWAALAIAVAAAGVAIGKTVMDMALNTSALNAQIEGLRARGRVLSREREELLNRGNAERDDLREKNEKLGKEVEGKGKRLARAGGATNDLGALVEKTKGRLAAQRGEQLTNRLLRQGKSEDEAVAAGQRLALSLLDEFEGRSDEAFDAAAKAFVEAKPRGGKDSIASAIVGALQPKVKSKRGRGKKSTDIFDREGYSAAVNTFRDFGILGDVDLKGLRQEFTHKKGRGKKERPLTAEEILERDFGAGLGDAVGKTGIRPSLGTTINKITNEYSPNVSQQFTVSQRDGESGESFAQRVAEISRREMDTVFRRANDHFLGAVTG